jgi:hypothetical protein
MSPLETELLRQSLGWRISPHARERAAQRGYTRQEVLCACVAPEVTHTSCRAGLLVYKRGTVSVVVNPQAMAVVTVLHRSHEPWIDDDPPGAAPVRAA